LLQTPRKTDTQKKLFFFLWFMFLGFFNSFSFNFHWHFALRKLSLWLLFFSLFICTFNWSLFVQLNYFPLRESEAQYPIDVHPYSELISREKFFPSKVPDEHRSSLDFSAKMFSVLVLLARELREQNPTTNERANAARKTFTSSSQCALRLFGLSDRQFSTRCWCGGAFRARNSTNTLITRETLSRHLIIAIPTAAR
jgi:hypothetical protein